PSRHEQHVRLQARFPQRFDDRPKLFQILLTDESAPLALADEDMRPSLVVTVSMHHCKQIALAVPNRRPGEIVIRLKRERSVYRRMFAQQQQSEQDRDRFGLALRLVGCEAVRAIFQWTTQPVAPLIAFERWREQELEAALRAAHHVGQFARRKEASVQALGASKLQPRQKDPSREQEVEDLVRRRETPAAHVKALGRIERPIVPDRFSGLNPRETGKRIISREQLPDAGYA